MVSHKVQKVPLGPAARLLHTGDMIVWDFERKSRGVQGRKWIAPK